MKKFNEKKIKEYIKLEIIIKNQIIKWNWIIIRIKILYKTQFYW